MEYKRFFAELVPRLDSARVLKRELDRKLAHRFNVFDYLRHDSEQERVPELLLSRIIADLLNPKAKHGQGKLFLRAFLDAVGLHGDRSWPALDKSRKILVDVERVIKADQRIDVSVHIDSADGKTYCLAIENKPYAGDQGNQVQDYLAWLNGKYPERFLLLYISPNGEGPSEESVPSKKLVELKDRFAIMPYCGGQEEQADKFKDFRIPHSLADWLSECQKKCEVDRLRWFLRDFETYCQQKFGGQAMITDSEKTAAIDFVLLNQSNLKTAMAVHESWADVEKRICKKFLNRLCSRIETAIKGNEKLKEFAGDMRFCCEYEDKQWGSYVCLYSVCWIEYQNPVEQKISRTCIKLNSDGKVPSAWYIGVCSPMESNKMPSDHMKRRQRLDEGLKKAFRKDAGKWSVWCPWYEYVNADKRDWRQLVPELHQECKGQSDEITSYFVVKFTEVAEKAIPIINGIEGRTDVAASSDKATERPRPA